MIFGMTHINIPHFVMFKQMFDIIISPGQIRFNISWCLTLRWRMGGMMRTWTTRRKWTKMWWSWKRRRARRRRRRQGRRRAKARRNR